MEALVAEEEAEEGFSTGTLAENEAVENSDFVETKLQNGC